MTYARTTLIPTLVLLFASSAGLVLTISPLRAEPVWGKYYVEDFVTTPTLNYSSQYASVDVLKNDPSNHPDLRSPGPGTVRFLFWPGEFGQSDHGLYTIAVQGFAFNTDLAFSPAQLQGPEYTATPNALVPGLGRFSWVLKAPSPFWRIGGFDITGLGDNISLSHFVLPATPDGANSSRAWFAADIVAYAYPTNTNGESAPPESTEFWASASLPETAPEPSTLLLAGLGLFGLLGWYAVRRRNLQAMA